MKKIKVLTARGTLPPMSTEQNNLWMEDKLTPLTEMEVWVESELYRLELQMPEGWASFSCTDNEIAAMSLVKKGIAEQSTNYLCPAFRLSKNRRKQCKLNYRL